MEKREKLALLSCMYSGSWTAVAEALKNNTIPKKQQIKDHYITVYDPEYPEAFRSLRYPPWVLFFKGDLSLLKKPLVSIVGSRELTPYGIRATEEAAEALKNDYVLVSGLAKGADGLVHEHGLKGMGTIGIIGSGLAVKYPWENRNLYDQMEKHGLILSEYPHDTGVQRHHFPWRNRLIAALGQFLVVTQAKVRSGTMLTVNEAAALGKEVYCFPYPYDDEHGKGCNRLIADGAIPVYDVHQLKVRGCKR